MGGAIYLDKTNNITVCDCQFSSNRAEEEGSDIYSINTIKQILIKSTIFNEIVKGESLNF